MLKQCRQHRHGHQCEVRFVKSVQYAGQFGLIAHFADQFGNRAVLILRAALGDPQITQPLGPALVNETQQISGTLFINFIYFAAAGSGRWPKWTPLNVAPPRQVLIRIQLQDELLTPCEQTPLTLRGCRPEERWG